MHICATGTRIGGRDPLASGVLEDRIRGGRLAHTSLKTPGGSGGTSSREECGSMAGAVLKTTSTYETVGVGYWLRPTDLILMCSAQQQVARSEPDGQLSTSSTPKSKKLRGLRKVILRVQRVHNLARNAACAVHSECLRRRFARSASLLWLCRRYPSRCLCTTEPAA